MNRTALAEPADGVIDSDDVAGQAWLLRWLATHSVAILTLYRCRVTYVAKFGLSAYRDATVRHLLDTLAAFDAVNAHVNGLPDSSGGIGVSGRINRRPPPIKGAPVL